MVSKPDLARVAELRKLGVSRIQFGSDGSISLLEFFHPEETSSTIQSSAASPDTLLADIVLEDVKRHLKAEQEEAQKNLAYASSD